MDNFNAELVWRKDADTHGQGCHQNGTRQNHWVRFPLPSISECRPSIPSSPVMRGAVRREHLKLPYRPENSHVHSRPFKVPPEKP